MNERKKEYALNFLSDFEIHTHRYVRPWPDNAKLFHLLGERPYQTGRDRSRVRVVLQLSVASAVIRVFPRGGRKGGREIVPGEYRTRGGNDRGSHRCQGEPAKSKVSYSSIVIVRSTISRLRNEIYLFLQNERKSAFDQHQRDRRRFAER